MPTTDDGGLYGAGDGEVSRDMARDINPGKAEKIRGLIMDFAYACGPVNTSLADEQGYLPLHAGGYTLYELGEHLNSIWVGDELLNDDYAPRNRNLYHDGKIAKLNGYKRRSPRAPYNEVWVHRGHVHAVPIILPRVAALNRIRGQLATLYVDMPTEDIEEVLSAFRADADKEIGQRV